MARAEHRIGVVGRVPVVVADAALAGARLRGVGSGALAPRDAVAVLLDVDLGCVEEEVLDLDRVRQRLGLLLGVAADREIPVPTHGRLQARIEGGSAHLEDAALEADHLGPGGGVDALRAGREGEDAAHEEAPAGAARRGGADDAGSSELPLHAMTPNVHGAHHTPPRPRPPPPGTSTGIAPSVAGVASFGSLTGFW